MKTYKISAFDNANELINKNGFVIVKACNAIGAVNKAAELLNLNEGNLVQVFSEKGKFLNSICFLKVKCYGEINIE